jgi:dTDP-4-amino-4,6-dideoxygalactose transaminase
MGKRAGSFGTAGCFSFYPFKILGAFGDGGAITTNEQEIARIASLLRYNGEDRATGEYHYHGYTALLDNVQAAVLDVKLRHLPSWIEHRRNIARLYSGSLQDIPEVTTPHFDSEPFFDVFQNYVIRTTDRDKLHQHLRREGVEALVHWPKPMWEHSGLGLHNPGLAETEAICREVISLPMSAETTPEHVEITVEAIQQYFASRSVAVAGTAH